MSDALNSSDVALSAKALTLLPKILLAMVGAIFALVLSGDISNDDSTYGNCGCMSLEWHCQNARIIRDITH